MNDPILEIRCYTDPHCAICWGMEPVLLALKEIHGPRLRLRPVMGGLVPDMRGVDNPTLIGSWHRKTADRWLEISRKYRMPVETGIFEDLGRRRFSSYPACIAVSAARLQDHAMSLVFLRRMRQAFAAERRDIQNLRVQIALAIECGLRKDPFIAAIQGSRADSFFRTDLAECKEREIGGLPAYLLRGRGKEILLRGYTPLDVFTGAVEKILEAPTPAIRPEATAEEIYNFISRHGQLASVEIEMVFDVDRDHVAVILAQLVQRGLIREARCGDGALYRLPEE